MSDEIKSLAGESAKLFEAIPENKRELAAYVAEAYIAGIATGAELAKQDAPETNK